MYRITLAYFMRLGEVIEDLRKKSVESTPHHEARYALLSAQSSLQEVQGNGVLAHALRASYKPIHELLVVIDRMLHEIDSLEKKIADGIPESEDPPLQELDFLDVWEIDDAIKKFYAVFGAEIEVAPAYLVLTKGAFDTNTLLTRGEALFPPDLIAKLPDTLKDAQAAAQCLAFELSTACGFHLLRVVEAVLRKYWEVVTSGDPLPDPANMGNILHHLDNRKIGDLNVKAAVRQIKNLHRNPLMHPEVHLDLEQAIGLAGMSQSVIRAMLALIP